MLGVYALSATACGVAAPVHVDAPTGVQVGDRVTLTSEDRVLVAFPAGFLVDEQDQAGVHVLLLAGQVTIAGSCIIDGEKLEPLTQLNWAPPAQSSKPTQPQKSWESIGCSGDKDDLTGLVLTLTTDTSGEFALCTGNCDPDEVGRYVRFRILAKPSGKPQSTSAPQEPARASFDSGAPVVGRWIRVAGGKDEVTFRSDYPEVTLECGPTQPTGNKCPVESGHEVRLVIKKAEGRRSPGKDAVIGELCLGNCADSRDPKRHLEVRYDPTFDWPKDPPKAESPVGGAK